MTLTDEELAEWRKMAEAMVEDYPLATPDIVERFKRTFNSPTIVRLLIRLLDELSQLRAQAADREKTNFERGAPALVMVLHGAIRQFLDEQNEWFETHGSPVKFGASFGAINRLQKVYDDMNIQAAMWGEFIPPRAQGPMDRIEAAAPALLKALHGMVDAYWRGSEDSDDDDAPTAVKHALAAIAAAEGEA